MSAAQFTSIVRYPEAQVALKEVCLLHGSETRIVLGPSGQF